MRHGDESQRKKQPQNRGPASSFRIAKKKSRSFRGSQGIFTQPFFFEGGKGRKGPGMLPNQPEKKTPTRWAPENDHSEWSSFTPSNINGRINKWVVKYLKPHIQMIGDKAP